MSVETTAPAERAEPVEPSPARRDWRWPLAVAGLLLGALALRLWGIKWGLPFTYNVDERAHFAPKAVEFFDGDLNPHYQLNPPAFSYALAAVYALWYHSGDAVRDAYANDPGESFLVARVATALMSTAAVGLLYLAGARLFGRWVGLLSAAVLAVAFLPVFYAHQAINDAPTLAPVAFSLWGAALVLRRGRWLDYAIAGFGAGLATGFKYNAGIILLAMVAGALVHFVDGARRQALIGAIIGGAAALGGFLLVDPYALLDFSTFREAMKFLIDYNARPPLIGEQQDSGWVYYGWTLSWGLGWIPLVSAIAGAVLMVKRDWRAALVVVPTALIFFVYMGSQGRYFGRYMLPLFPTMCLLAGYFGVAAAQFVGARRPRLLVPAAIAVAVLVLGQGLVTSLHNDMVLARKDTRTDMREWMEANIPPKTTIVVEPAVPRGWYRDGGLPEIDLEAERWTRWRRTDALVKELEQQFAGAGRRADFQNYVLTMFPGMIDVYRRDGACWYLRSSSQSGRAFVEPSRSPEAVEFYNALEREADVAHISTPYGKGTEPLPFQFDYSFNYYPLAHERPGPVMTLYRLRDCA